MTKQSRRFTLVHIWQGILQLVPKVFVAPINDNARFQVQPQIGINVPTVDIAQNDDDQFGPGIP